ncbi:hypothetical protein HYY74_02085 [Candidatus Woesearchaeota archaeon]|nr:hypothetical protein [Candidatus Woesearchaeota archaeon]
MGSGLAAPSTRKAMKKEDLADYLKMLDSATCYGSDLASKPAYKAAA